MATAKSDRASSAATTRKTTPAKSPAKTTAGSAAKKPAKAPVKAAAKSPAQSVTARAHAHRAASEAANLTTPKSASSKAEKKKDKPEKVKVLRDSFTIPKAEFAQIAALKKRAMALGQEVKKSELLRAGLLLLGKQSDTALLKALAAVPTLKTGRPGKA